MMQDEQKRRDLLSQADEKRRRLIEIKAREKEAVKRKMEQELEEKRHEKEAKLQ